MSYHAEIQRAIEAAPLIIDGGAEPYLNDFSPHRDLPDDAIIRIGYSDSTPEPHIVYAPATPGDDNLRALFRAFEEVTGVNLGNSVVGDYVDRAARHEAHHVNAARMLGATDSKYGLAIYMSHRH
jgi:hypothetical protein